MVARKGRGVGLTIATGLAVLAAVSVAAPTPAHTQTPAEAQAQRLASLTRDLAQNPKDAARLAQRGAIYLQERRFDLALQDFNQSLLLDPDNADTLNKRGLTYARGGNLPAAIRDYSRAIEINAGSANLYINRGAAFVDQQQYSRALPDLDKAIQLQPDSAEAHFARSMIFEATGEYGSAVKDMDAAIRIDPNHQDFYLQRGFIRLEAAEYAASVDDFQRAIVQKPDAPYPPLWLHIARVHAHQDDAQEFAANTAKLSATAWPAPIIAFYAGKTSVADARAKAAVGDPAVQRGQGCEADYYIGVIQTAGSDTTDKDWAAGKAALEAAASECPDDFNEKKLAVAALLALSTAKP
ncbi:MAG TPA: tetratricopeptide repeat protein [Stellaceae bacterium]|nr:tetratricopeptide repeat protein [Stellaceae bacterium]